MASGVTPIYDLPYPVLTDPVNVHGDIKDLADRLELILPNLGLPFFTYEVTNNSGGDIAKGDPVYFSGYSEVTSKTTVEKSDADILGTFPVIGLAQSNIANGTDGVLVISGVFANVNTSSYSAGDILYVASGGGLTNTVPVTGSGTVGVVAKSDPTTGIIIVANQSKGNGTWGALKAGLS